MKNKNEAEALNERLLAEMVAEVRPKIECPPRPCSFTRKAGAEGAA
jgi:hypothetical protein